jgi:hypothetical protein
MRSGTAPRPACTKYPHGRALRTDSRGWFGHRYPDQPIFTDQVRTRGELQDHQTIGLEVLRPRLSAAMR